MWLIVIGAFILICIVCFSSDSENSSCANNTPKSTFVNENTFRYLTNNPAEQQWASANIRDGIVYCYGHSEFKVGSYEISEDGRIIVWDAKHELRIGFLYPQNRSIHLNNADLFAKIKKNRPYCPTPTSFVYDAAHWIDGAIFDNQTREQIAVCQGDPIACAAAFVCLTYDLLTENKYYRFFNSFYM